MNRAVGLDRAREDEPAFRIAQLDDVADASCLQGGGVGRDRRARLPRRRP